MPELLPLSYLSSRFKPPTATSSSSSLSSSSPSAPVHLSHIKSVPNSGARCIICGKKVESGYTKIPYFARQELLLDHRALIGPSSNSCICLEHLNGDHLKPDIEISTNLPEDSNIGEKEAAEVIEDLIQAMKKYRNTWTIICYGPDRAKSNSDLLSPSCR